MPFFWSGIGLFAFAALSGYHFLSLWHVACYFMPVLTPVFAVLFPLMWLCGLWLLFLFGVRRNKLKACLMAVFVYVMAIILTGTQVLEGVPDQVGAKQWRDPHHRLTPGAKYLLHNHANVVREISEAEYRLYLDLAACYFSAGFMLFATGLCLTPLDRDGQLRNKPKVIRSIDDSTGTATARCSQCRGQVSADSSGHWPAWCPQCGTSF